MEKKSTSNYSSDVVIIGAGISGINMARQLQQSLGVTDYVIYERSHELGGAWSANKYPGCGVDIPGVMYQLSSDPNMEYSSIFPSQREVLAYIQRVARSHGVQDHICYGTRVSGATWIEASKIWHIDLEQADTGASFTHDAKVLISAVGAYTNPQYPHLQGLESFEGPVVHTAQWDTSLDVRGRDVIVIGNGCSATQVVPAIANEVTSLTQFVRTPQHLVPKAHVDVSGVIGYLLKFPLALLITRWIIFWYLELTLLQFYNGYGSSRMRNNAMRQSRKYVTETAPTEYHDLLLPEFELGCKRRIIDDKYTSCLHAPNVNVVQDEITFVGPSYVETLSGKQYHTDFIILATGFTFTQWSLNLTGRNGVPLAQHWAQLGGKGAYRTVAMADFPNFFYVLGPNSGSGHTSVLFASECAARLITRLITPVLRRQISSVEVRAEAEKEWCRSVQRALQKTVLASGCGSHFVDPKTGWNHFSSPFGGWRVWMQARWITWADWRCE